MINKELVVEVFAATRSLTITGKILHMSKQRVSQIVANIPVKNLLKLCILCHRKAFLIRRVDGNEGNNWIQNLIPLCIRCMHIIDTYQ